MKASLLATTLVAACGTGGASRECSMQITVNDQPAVTMPCIAGATSASQSSVDLGQSTSNPDFTNVGLHLFFSSAPTTRVYDIGNVQKPQGIITNKAGNRWSLLHPGPDPFQFTVTSMEVNDLEGSTIGFAIHGSAKATMTADAGTGATGVAALVASF
jgi:hypothetical protein